MFVSVLRWSGTSEWLAPLPQVRRCDNMQIFVHNVGTGNRQHVPLDRSNPGYWTSYFAGERKQGLELSAQYLSDEEWKELAQGINDSIKRNHWCSKWYIVCPFVATAGVCFCPMVIYGCMYPDWVNDDITKLPVVERLGARGIRVSWINTIPKIAQQGGVILNVPPGTAPAQQAMQR